MRFQERVAAITDNAVARYVSAERKRLSNIKAPEATQLLAKLEAMSEHALREKLAKDQRAKLHKRNASPDDCGAPVLDAVFDRAGLEGLLEQVRAQDFDSVREMERLIEIVARNVPDPYFHDYVNWPTEHGLAADTPVHEILDRALGHPGRVIAMEVVDVRIADRRDSSFNVRFSGASRTALASLRGDVPKRGEVWAVALVGAVLPDGTRVAENMTAKARANCVVLAKTDDPPGTDLTHASGCRAGIWQIGEGWR